ncbi:MAG: hypothetical protein BWY88_00112 [Synergistetes bacterium ADurb.Bin520]|nr:MAG: hypothetical protein BWY88_00112 [Synergistetes bacterium ADurb.Bin520]
MSWNCKARRFSSPISSPRISTSTGELCPPTSPGTLTVAMVSGRVAKRRLISSTNSSAVWVRSDFPTNFTSSWARYTPSPALPMRASTLPMLVNTWVNPGRSFSRASASAVRRVVVSRSRRVGYSSLT